MQVSITSLLSYPIRQADNPRRRRPTKPSIKYTDSNWINQHLCSINAEEKIYKGRQELE